VTPTAVTGPKHPAKFSAAILADLAELVLTGVIEPELLDLFAGVGGIHDLADRYHLLAPEDIVGVELEPEWANQHPRTIVGDATKLPADWTARFRTVVTSPAYGNRFADSYDGRDGSRRRTYRLDLGRPLTPGSGAALHFGPDYCRLHERAWAEARRVLVPGIGRLVLNVSNFIRDDEEVDVVGWHVATLDALGFILLDKRPIVTPRMRHGANHEARVAAELVLVFAAPLNPDGHWSPTLI
jgi:hypothetical protein